MATKHHNPGHLPGEVTKEHVHGPNHAHVHSIPTKRHHPSDLEHRPTHTHGGHATGETSEGWEPGE